MAHARRITKPQAEALYWSSFSKNRLGKRPHGRTLSSLRARRLIAGSEALPRITKSGVSALRAFSRSTRSKKHRPKAYR